MCVIKKGADLCNLLESFEKDGARTKILIDDDESKPLIDLVAYAFQDMIHMKPLQAIFSQMELMKEKRQSSCIGLTVMSNNSQKVQKFVQIKSKRNIKEKSK